MQKFIIYFLIFNTGLIASCSHQYSLKSLDQEVKSSTEFGICSATSFLRKNGYIEPKSVANKDSVDLEIWDNLTYEKNGVIDWTKLLAERSGTFDNRLYGIRIRNDDYLIYYKFDEYYQCIAVGKKSNDAYMIEANCLTDTNLIRVEENLIDCSKT